MKLGDCPVGTKVRVWCIGTMRWDDLVGVITRKGFFVTVEYSPYNIAEFVDSVEVIVEGFSE